MITKEQLVCTRVQASRLKDRGIPQTSIFYYNKFSDSYGDGWALDDFNSRGVSAYTAAELIELLNYNRWQMLWLMFKTGLNPVMLADVLIYKLWNSK